MRKIINIGLATAFSKTGNYYLARNYRHVLDSQPEKFSCFILARPTSREGVWLLENSDEWSDDYPQNKGKIYRIKENRWALKNSELVEFIKKYKIDILIFNEHDQFEQTKICKMLGVKTVFLVDFMRGDKLWKDAMQEYDLLLCTSWRSQNHCISMGYTNSRFVSWGIDTKIFKPEKHITQKKYLFGHCAGTIGVGARKGSDFVITAFDELTQENKLPLDAQLFLHSQIDLFKSDRVSEEIKEILRYNWRIVLKIQNDVNNKGYYNDFFVYLAPSRTEGLGIPIFESLACGTPVITNDFGPMNEFIINNYNGMLSKIKGVNKRWDNIAFNECEADIEDLKKKMLDFMSIVKLANIGDERYCEYSENALATIKEKYDLHNRSENSFYTLFTQEMLRLANA